MQTYLFALSNEPPCSNLVLTLTPLTSLVHIYSIVDLASTVEFASDATGITNHFSSFFSSSFGLLISLVVISPCGVGIIFSPCLALLYLLKSLK
jgi:hypothetical protein